MSPESLYGTLHLGRVSCRDRGIYWIAVPLFLYFIDLNERNLLLGTSGSCWESEGFSLSVGDVYGSSLGISTTGMA